MVSKHTRKYLGKYSFGATLYENIKEKQWKSTKLVRKFKDELGKIIKN
jgi:hypothetical protein